MKQLSLEEFETYHEYLSKRRAEVQLLLSREQEKSEPDGTKIERFLKWNARLTAILENGRKGVMPFRCEICGFIYAREESSCPRCRDRAPGIFKRISWRLGWEDF